MFRLIAVLTLVSVTNLVQAEPLSFDAVLELAQRNAPDLTAQTASVDAAQAAVIAAGRLPDPKLAIGVDNVPATGADQWSLTRDFMTMRKIGLMQDIPNRGKRQAEVDVATAAIAQAQAERRVRLLQIKRDAAVAWLTRFYLERRATFFD